MLLWSWTRRRMHSYFFWNLLVCCCSEYALLFLCVLFWASDFISFKCYVIYLNWGTKQCVLNLTYFCYTGNYFPECLLFHFLVLNIFSQQLNSAITQVCLVHLFLNIGLSGLIKLLPTWSNHLIWFGLVWYSAKSAYMVWSDLVVKIW